jgi:cobyrinic acid a,c-diamide synthase
VIDASAMAHTAGALALGLRDYGPVDLAGVIANRVAGPAHAAMVASSLRAIPLLGHLMQQERSLPERHLGIAQPAEVANLDAMLDQMAGQLALDREAWIGMRGVRFDAAVAEEPGKRLLAGKTIAIARDAAFAFLYPANLDCLQALGARLSFFSPLADEVVPPNADAVYLPGGYPELHAAKLSRAAAWHASLQRAHTDGKPIRAECGGMMALAESLTDVSGNTWPMAGLLPVTVSMQTRLAGLGPQGLETPHGVLRGHTFHYSRLDSAVRPVAHTFKHPSGDAGEAVYRIGSLTASYFHAYFPSCPGAVAALFSGSSSGP